MDASGRTRGVRRPKRPFDFFDPQPCKETYFLVDWVEENSHSITSGKDLSGVEPSEVSVGDLVSVRVAEKKTVNVYQGYVAALGTLAYVKGVMKELEEDDDGQDMSDADDEGSTDCAVSSPPETKKPKKLSEAKGKGPEAKDKGPEAKGKGPEAKGKGAEAKGKGHEAKGKGPKAKGKGLEAKGKGSEAKGKGSEAKGKGAVNKSATDYILHNVDSKNVSSSTPKKTVLASHSKSSSAPNENENGPVTNSLPVSNSTSFSQSKQATASSSLPTAFTAESGNEMQSPTTPPSFVSPACSFERVGDTPPSCSPPFANSLNAVGMTPNIRRAMSDEYSSSPFTLAPQSFYGAGLLNPGPANPFTPYRSSTDRTQELIEHFAMVSSKVDLMYGLLQTCHHEITSLRSDVSRRKSAIRRERTDTPDSRLDAPGKESRRAFSSCSNDASTSRYASSSCDVEEGCWFGDPKTPEEAGLRVWVPGFSRAQLRSLDCKLSVRLLCRALTEAVFTPHELRTGNATKAKTAGVTILDANRLYAIRAWLNLDLGIETCFFVSLDAYYRTWPQFVFPICIWVLFSVIIVLANRSTFFARVIGSTNPVAVLATLFLLSYTKLLRAIMAAFSFTSLDYPNGDNKYVWLYDGNLKYLDGNDARHVCLFLFSLLFFFLVFLPYTLLLLFSQWIHRRIWWMSTTKQLYVKYFLDAYCAPYKQAHRYWVGLLLLLRFLMLFVTTIIDINNPQDPFSNLMVVLLVAVTVLAWLARGVYKKWYLDILGASFSFNIIILVGGTYQVRLSGGDHAAVVYTSTGIAFAIFVGIVVCTVVQRLKEKYPERYDKAIRWFPRKVMNRGNITDSLDTAPEASIGVSHVSRSSLVIITTEETSGQLELRPSLSGQQ